MHEPFKVTNFAGAPSLLCLLSTLINLTSYAVSNPTNPILVLATPTHYGLYLGEILKAEGFNEFQMESPADLGITLSYLNNYDVVILAQTPLAAAQKDLYAAYVEGGGNLVALRPDKQLASLLGLTDVGGTIDDGYLCIDPRTEIGRGLLSDTLQIHGSADRFALAGAVPLASLYRNSSTPTPYPAVVFHNYGKGHAAAFTYNLAGSIVLTHQGNPALAGQETDGSPYARAIDMYTGGFLDSSKNALNQADEQMRLLSRLIHALSENKKPLPRFWYFPEMNRSMVLLSGDGEGSPEPLLASYLADLKAKGVRETLFLMRPSIYSRSTVSNWIQDGFDIATHPDDSREVTHVTWTAMNAAVQQDRDYLKNRFNLSPTSTRTHCGVWCGVNPSGQPDFTGQMRLEENLGYGLDSSLAHYDANATLVGWLGGVGNFIGTGLLMRCCDTHGQIINVHEAPIQLFEQAYMDKKRTTNEFYQDFKTMLDASLDQGRSSWISLLAHPWGWWWAKDTVLRMLDYCQQRSVPVWTYKQALDFMKMKDQAAFGGVEWLNNQLSFTVSSSLTAPGKLTMMVPATFSGGQVTNVTKDGSTVSYAIRSIQGTDYALATVDGGVTSSFVVTYGGSSTTMPDAELGWQAQGTNGVVVAGRTGSAEAGLEILKKGGNAADAAAATILALSVTDHAEFCFGSEVPILIYEARRGVVEVISGMGTAPQLATREFFEKAGGIRQNTATAAAIPAAPDAIITLVERYGTLRFADVAEPALRLLDQHAKDWHADLAQTWRRMIAAESVSPDRRRGLRLAADCFYRGPIAREVDAWSRANNGLIRFRDLAMHASRIEEPVQADYRGYTVCKCGPWTQGPYLLQTLKLLEGFDLTRLGFQQPPTIHVIVEAMKLALADRDIYYGDPLFVEVPLTELLSASYTDMRRKLIDPDRASMVQRPGDPQGGKALMNEPEARLGLRGPTKDTTTCVVADRWGNVVAATPSGWSGVQAGHTGVWLGSRLISFNTWPGHPNCIEPGKRPRITLTPSLVLKNGKPVMAISVAGGDTQDQATLQMICNHLDFGRSADVLVTTPRYTTLHFTGSFNQPPPALGELMISPEMSTNAIARLKAMGHVIQLQTPPSWRIVICLDPETGMMHGAGDPTAGRHAGAF